MDKINNRKVEKTHKKSSDSDPWEQVQQVEQNKADSELDNKHDNCNNPKISLTVLIIDCMVDARTPQTSQKPTQMSEIVDIVGTD